jgi:hypothetical protein
MYFKIIKSGVDGISGSEQRYESIKEVLREISYHKGWDSKEELHKAIRNWAKVVRPGGIFCTQVSAIIALPVDSSFRQDDVCHHCDYEDGLDYEEIGPVEGVDGTDLEQRVSCPQCNKKWIDVFTLTDQRELGGNK